MSSAKDIFTHLLKESGYSVTKARLAVFEALLAQKPMSMHDLVAKLTAIDRASVYRAVELFEQLHILQRLYTGWKYKIELTDSFSEHHHHLTCTHCGRTIDMNEKALEVFIENLAKQHNFMPSAHQIEIQGLCDTCKQTGK